MVAATQMESSTEQPKAENASEARILAGLILGLGCFAAVLTGVILVGQNIGEALNTFQNRFSGGWLSSLKVGADQASISALSSAL